MTDPVIKVADRVIQCNASMFIKDCLSDIVPELTYQQKRDVVKARQNNWSIQIGEEYRYYIYDEEGPDCECCEIPEMSEICADLDLWP